MSGSAALNAREITERNFSRAAERLGLSAEQQLMLKTPFREVKVEVPVRMDDGSLRVFLGYRIQHSGVRGPAKGGLRYHLTNAGGVTVSYFEWAQNLQQVFWDEERVNGDLEKYMSRAYRTVADLAAHKKITLKEAAYQVAAERVARAEALRGA